VLVKAPSQGIVKWRKFSDSLPPFSPRVDLAFSICGTELPSPMSVADWNGDSMLDSSDFLGFLNSWSNREPRADLAPIGGNAAWNSDDFLAFLDAYSQGG
jgi:hypothetical protein